MRAHSIAAFGIGITAILILASFYLVYLNAPKQENRTENKSTTITQTSSQANIVPLTEGEADKALVGIDTDIQTTLNQIDEELTKIDLNSASEDTKQL
jgi:DNA uptake protein ComE-like DNA-binding protein